MFKALANPKKSLITATVHCHGLSVPSSFVMFMSMTVLLFLSLGNTVFAKTIVSSVRVWPAPEYTRLTLESALPIQYSLSMVRDPDRVVVDLEQVMLSPELESLPGKIDATDPYIRAVRIGRFKPTILRLVLDLKTEAVPQAFVLKPVGDYGYRLVLDIYPAIPPDPLMALLNENTTAMLQPDVNADGRAKRKGE